MLDVDALQVNYGTARALWNVSLTIGDGELVCVVGPNGAGKTTLINALAGIHPIHAGRVAIDGRDLKALPPHAFCDAGIAIVPEGRRLFTRMSVRENLEIGSYRPAARKTRARMLDDVCRLFPVLGDRLAAPAGTLSGGQQQMVAIGRALMARPRLLLLDEPSLGLSPVMVQAMFRTIGDVHRSGTAVLLVEQNVAMAFDLADRAYLLDEGRIVAEGTPGALVNDPVLRRAYLGLAPAA